MAMSLIGNKIEVRKRNRINFAPHFLNILHGAVDLLFNRGFAANS
jgi:hypothetical protein